MRRVAITGIGAVTPLGLDAPATWEAAVAGRSVVGFIKAFDASAFPVRIAAEVRGFEPESVASPKEVRRLERNVLLAVGAAGLGFGLAAGLCGLGQGRAAGSAVDAMARQPGAIARIQTAMLLGLAFIESLTLFVFVIAVILLFVKS